MYRMIQKIHLNWQKLHIHISAVVAFTWFKGRHTKITAFWDVKLCQQFGRRGTLICGKLSPVFMTYGRIEKTIHYNSCQACYVGCPESSVPFFILASNKAKVARCWMKQIPGLWNSSKKLLNIPDRQQHCSITSNWSQWCMLQTRCDRIHCYQESLRNIQRCLCNVYGGSVINRSTNGCWTKKVTASETGKEKLPDFPHSGYPVTAVSSEMLQQGDAIIC